MKKIIFITLIGVMCSSVVEEREAFCMSFFKNIKNKSNDKKRARAAAQYFSDQNIAKKAKTSCDKSRKGLTALAKQLEKRKESYRKLSRNLKTFNPTRSSISKGNKLIKTFTRIREDIQLGVDILGSVESALTASEKIKKQGDSKSVEALEHCRLGAENAEELEIDSALDSATIACVGKTYKRDGREVNNAGELKNLLTQTLRDLREQDTALSAALEALEDLRKVTDDDEVRETLKSITFYLNFLSTSLKNYDDFYQYASDCITSRDSSNFVKFCKEIEEDLAGVAITVKSKMERDEELDDLGSRNKGNVSSRAGELAKSFANRSAKGERMYRESLDPYDRTEVGKEERRRGNTRDRRLNNSRDYDDEEY